MMRKRCKRGAGKEAKAIGKKSVSKVWALKLADEHDLLQDSHFNQHQYVDSLHASFLTLECQTEQIDR